jgi:hypothetical protein
VREQARRAARSGAPNEVDEGVAEDERAEVGEHGLPPRVGERARQHCLRALGRAALCYAATCCTVLQHGVLCCNVLHCGSARARASSTAVNERSHADLIAAMRGGSGQPRGAEALMLALKAAGTGLLPCVISTVRALANVRLSPAADVGG